MTTAGQKKIELMNVEKRQQMGIQDKREIAFKVEAVDEFKKFLVAGNLSKLSAKDVKVILKFVIPLLASHEKFME